MTSQELKKQINELQAQLVVMQADEELTKVRGLLASIEERCKRLDAYDLQPLQHTLRQALQYACSRSCIR